MQVGKSKKGSHIVVPLTSPRLKRCRGPNQLIFPKIHPRHQTMMEEG